MKLLLEWVCETPGESDKQVAEAVIPALKDKSIEVLFFLTFRTLKMRQIGGSYSDVGYLFFLFCKNRVAPRSHSSRHGVKTLCRDFSFSFGKIQL